MKPTHARALFAGTIFLSAFLLFLVQPLIAKQILPWFGGSAAVWSVCMVFFQVVLLAGYAYSDWSTRRLRVRTQARLHIALLLASLAFLPIVASARWKPSGTEDPALWILGLLAATIGLPYFLLSTTGPLVQSWVARTPWGAQVYRYFSLSNLASLVSLLCYPLVIEPRSTVQQQAWGWSGAYAVFVLLCAGTTLYMARHWAIAAPATPASAAGTAAKPRSTDYLLWLALPALGSWLLLAMTNHITQNVAAVPFLWVLPLSVYLLSFVLTFESDRWYRRRLFLPLAAAMLVLCAFGLQHRIGAEIKTALPIYVIGLFALCMFLHGEMARLRPASPWLTRFYLMLSLGGAIGGVSVGLVAPHVLPAYYELGIGLVLCALAAAVLWHRRPLGIVASLAVAGCCAWFLSRQVHNDMRGQWRMERNFYGALLTSETRVGVRGPTRKLYHGSTKHGEQYLAHALRREPTSYYGRNSGIGRAIAAAPLGTRRVGLIGLGAGTLAAYGRPGDVYRFYEINPAVFQLADREFSFLADSAARIERVLGDARLSLHAEPPQRFDVLAIDAFSGDSIPVHLITTEALDVYLRHLQPEGVIAFHVSNRYLALAPVVESIALAKGLHAALVEDQPPKLTGLDSSDWVLVARDPRVLLREPLRGATSGLEPRARLRPWTDDFNNLFEVLK
ncbi:fused MFS/spermidine synthase [Variovorax guangxiensis]|uniref:fused MFS/spermidine synthase n=1 Tax=Variovorax guangxiensis TaxID=1775474 RepID=UPI002854CE96|nr:fused MFS/spermidine synthase [Variovorax guangxiensis]MDR6856244.1 SAM-dependent methyltransferase [Variovorax guangxiensis]